MKYKRFQKSSCVFKVMMTFKTPEMTFRVLEKMTFYFILFSIIFFQIEHSKINSQFQRNHIYWHMTLH